MTSFEAFLRAIVNILYPLALVYIMTNFRYPLKTIRIAFSGVALFGVVFNLLMFHAFGREMMMRFFAASIAVPCIFLLLFLSKDRFSQHFFNFFTAINVLYLVSIVVKLLQRMDDNIWIDILIKTFMYSFVLHLFHRYWSGPYHFLSVHVKKGWGIISIIPFLFFALVMFLGLYPTVRTDNFFAVIFLYIILCCVYLVIYDVFRNTYDLLMREQERQVLTLQLSAQKQYYETKLGNEKELHRLKHDMQGHLATISALLADEKVQEASSYLAQLTSMHQSRQTELICENPYLNAVLGIFEKRFRENDIPFEYRIHMGELSLPGEALSLILNNALQNAQEAVMQIPQGERTIHLRTAVNYGQLLIRISNRFCGTLHEENGLPVTTKTEQGHGYGLSSIRVVVNQLGGTVSYSTQDGRFELDVAIPEKQDA